LNTPPPPGRPRQPFRSLPLNRFVKPAGAGLTGCAATVPARSANAARPPLTRNSMRIILLAADNAGARKKPGGRVGRRAASFSFDPVLVTSWSPSYRGDFHI